MNIQQRLDVFFLRLATAPAVASAEEAFGLICHTLENVENEFCLVAKKNPPPRWFDGRMYPPQKDSIKVRDDGSLWIKTRRHRIVIQTDGSFVVLLQVKFGSMVEQFRKGGVRA